MTQEPITGQHGESPSVERGKALSSTALFCLQASDVFNDWETVYEFPTREQAERMKEKREAEPVIYCPVHWRIVEQNSQDQARKASH